MSISGKCTVGCMGAGEKAVLEVDNPTPEQIFVIRLWNGMGERHEDKVAHHTHWDVKNIEKNVYTVDDKGMTASDH